MATIYRFIVEQQQGMGGGSGRNNGSTTKKNAKDKYFTLSGSLGVEHNRKLRAINPVLNKATGGYWEKGMRLGRAGLGLLTVKKKGKGAMSVGISATALAIILSFVIQTGIKHHQKLIQQSEKENKQNFKKMETGETSVHTSFTVATNMWSGKRTYNENK